MGAKELETPAKGEKHKQHQPCKDSWNRITLRLTEIDQTQSSSK